VTDHFDEIRTEMLQKLVLITPNAVDSA